MVSKTGREPTQGSAGSDPSEAANISGEGLAILKKDKEYLSMRKSKHALNL